MKRAQRVLSVFLAAALLLCAGPLSGFAGIDWTLPDLGKLLHLSAHAADEKSGTCGDGLTWAVDGNGVLTVSGSGAMADYSYRDKAPWNALAESVTKVVMQEGVTRIGSYAFLNLKNISAVTVPKGVKTVGQFAFGYCEKLKKIELPDSVTELGDYAFYYCSGLEQARLSNNLPQLNDRSFYGCGSLKTINLPSRLESIGADAFHGCASLQPVALPSSLKRIGSSAFDGCKAFSGALVIPNGVSVIEPYAFESCSLLTSVTLGSGVTEIGRQAFAYCEKLNTVSFSSKLKTINESAFYGCKALETIPVLPDSVEWIGGNAFYNTAWYSAQPVGLVMLGKFAYSYKYNYWNRTADLELSIPSGTKMLVGNFLHDYTGNLTVTLPESLSYIGANAFSDCLGLKKLHLPSKLKTIGNAAFSNCSALSEINWPETLQSVGASAFENCLQLKSAVLPASLKGLSERVFSNCESLKTVTLPAGMTSIGEKAFFNCRSLASVTLPTGLLEIGKAAFKGCALLPEITVPVNVREIPYECFYLCKSMKTVRLTKRLETVGAYAFGECGALGAVSYTGSAEEWQSITVDAGNTSLTGANKTYKASVSNIGVYQPLQEVEIFYVEDEVGGSGLLPADVPAQYQIKAAGAVSFAQKEGKSLRISNDGLLTPYYEEIWTTSIGLVNGSSYGRYVKYYEPGVSLVYAYDADGAIVGRYRVTVSAYLPKDSDLLYAEQVMQDYIDANIRSGMTGKEKLQKICEFVCSYPYSVNHSGYVGMIASGEGGDCWASASTVVRMCEMVGIHARGHEDEFVTMTYGGHMYAVAEADGKWYTIETGYYQLTTPRPYSLIEHDSPFHFSSIGSTGELQVDAYYGFGGDVTVPAVHEGSPVTVIDSGCFSHSTRYLSKEDKITSITVEDGIREIGDSAFWSYCNNATISLPKSVSEIGMGAFNGNTGLRLRLDPANPYFYNDDHAGILYSKDKTRLYCAWGLNDGEVVLPSGLKYIEDCAFYDDDVISDITFPASLVDIGYAAFRYCSKLHDIVIPANVTGIGYSAFYWTSLNSITFLGSNCLINNTEENNLKDQEDGYTLDSPKQIFGAAGSTIEAYYNQFYTGKSNVSFSTSICTAAKQNRRHSFGTITVEKAPNCQDSGRGVYTCSSCGLTYSESIQPLTDGNDVWSDRWYGEDSLTHYRNCEKGPHKQVETHQFGESSSVTPASFDQDGSVTYMCEICKYTYTFAIPGVSDVILSASKLSYNGYSQRPTVTVKDRTGKSLVKGTDYTVSYPNESRVPGDYSATVTLTGNYTGSVAKTYSIARATLRAEDVTLSWTSKTYNGSVQKPTVTVKSASGSTLTKDTSYTLSWSGDCKAAGTYTVTVTGKGNYSGSVSKQFTITSANQKTLSSSNVTLGWSSKAYTGGVQRPSVTVKNASGSTLTKDTSYTVRYSGEGKLPGTYTVTVTGKGNYTGTVKKTYTITKATLASSNVTLSWSSRAYNGGVQKPTVTVKSASGSTLTKGTSYTVSYASESKQPATYTVTVTGKGNYTGTVKKTYTITKATLASSNVTLGWSSRAYSGSVQKPTVTVKSASGSTLTKGTSYTVSYASESKLPGTYTVTVTGKGNYTGTVKKTYTISKAALAASRVTLSWSTKTYNGSVQKPTVTVKSASGSTLTNGTSYAVSYSGDCKAVGSYTVTVTGKGNYAGTVKKTFEIKAREIRAENVTLSRSSFTYDGKMHRPTVTVRNDAGDILTKDVSYFLAYSDGCTNKGTYVAVVVGQGNYTGTVSRTFTIK